jgi:hypothetical protein
MTAPKYRDEIRGRLQEIKDNFMAQLRHEISTAMNIESVEETYTFDKYKNFLTIGEMTSIFKRV